MVGCLVGWLVVVIVELLKVYSLEILLMNELSIALHVHRIEYIYLTKTFSSFPD